MICIFHGEGIQSFTLSAIALDVLRLIGMTGPPYEEFDKMVDKRAPSDKLDKWAEEMISQVLRTTRHEEDDKDKEPTVDPTDAPKCLSPEAKLRLMNRNAR
ncbi:hypothetical protein GCK32_000336 [Trichostrongylus colubriformis]|uniref:Uncharacterized protein n=1 Tax=Trichostrongylus colubriformis TaxID=6319 RepID=A0AAN8IQ90_TRICO